MVRQVNILVTPDLASLAFPTHYFHRWRINIITVASLKYEIKNLTITLDDKELE